MSTVDAERGPVAAEDTERFIDEIVRAAGPEGIDDPELMKAYNLVTEWMPDTGIIALRHAGTLTLRWDAKNQDLSLAFSDRFAP